MKKCRNCICKNCIKSCKCFNCKEPVKICNEKQEFKQISLVEKKKLTRLFTWQDYGITKERYDELKALCQSGKYDDVARSEARRANEIISEYILLSVKKNLSFEGVEYAKGLGRIPCGRTDFYGYRRLFYHLFDERIRENGY